VLRNFVTQPLARAAKYPDVLRLEPDFLVQFPVHRLFRRFAGIDAALRKLPGMLSDSFTPENQVPAVDDNDGDVRAIAVTVEHRGHPDAKLIEPIVAQSDQCCLAATLG
jgi:hypothetical protein